MKSSAIELILVTTLFVLLGCAASRPDIAELASEGVEIRTYQVFGMDCPGCHGGLEKLVNKIPEVISSKANWEKQELQVALNPGVNLDDDAVLEAIKLANFTPGKRLK